MREYSLKEMMQVTDQCFTSWVLPSMQALFHVQLVPMIPKPTCDGINNVKNQIKEALTKYIGSKARNIIIQRTLALAEIMLIKIMSL